MEGGRVGEVREGEFSPHQIGVWKREGTRLKLYLGGEFDSVLGRIEAIAIDARGAMQWITFLWDAPSGETRLLLPWGGIRAIQEAPEEGRAENLDVTAGRTMEPQRRGKRDDVSLRL